MAAVRFHPAADEDLLEATDWYIARSATAAVGFVREIEHALARIGEAPERYPLTRFGRRRFVLLNYPYDVVYRIIGSDVESSRWHIMRVSLHTGAAADVARTTGCEVAAGRGTLSKC